MSQEKLSHRLLTRWADWSLTHAVWVFIASLLVIIGAWFYTAENLSINTDTTDLVAPEARFQQNRRNFEKAFPQDMRTILLVVESSTPELTKAASLRLSRLLSADQDNFESVYTLSDNEYFRRNGLLYLDVNDLQKLSTTMAEAQPFIGRIAQQTNLTGFFSIIDDALTATDAATDLPLDLPSLIEKVAKALHTGLNGGDQLLSWQQLIAGKKMSPTSSFIQLRPKFDYNQIRPAEQAINAIHKSIAAIQEPGLPQVKVWITGEVGLEDDELSGMSNGTFNASIFSAFFVIGILLLAYRSLWLSVATVITISLGMILCGAFAAFAVKELNLISVAFAVTNIGLGVEYAIHFCLRYKDNLMHHISREKAIRGTLIATSPSLLLCASTTAIGLYAFIPTDYQGVSELGLLAGSSLFICLSVTLIVLPVVLKLIPINLTPKPEADDSWLVQIPEHLAQFTLHYAKPIAVIVGILAVLGLALLGKVETDFNPINLRDPNTDSVIAFKHLLKDKDTSPMTLSVLVDSEDKVKTLQQQLETLPTVEKTVSLYDFIPEDQDDKLAIIEQMSLTLGLNTTKFPVLSDDPNPVLGIEHLLATIDTVLPNKTNAKEIAVLKQFKIELQGLLLELNNRQQTSRHLFMETMQTSVIGTLPSVMNDLLVGLNADTVTLNDLPTDLKERWLSKDGQYRIQIYPKRDLNELSELERFITDVQTIAPDATDLPVLYWESMQAVVKAFEQAIAIAIITIAIVLYAIRRNLTDTLLIMTPLLLAGVLTMASTVLTHTPVNFANIIALPLLLGFGVDNGIHMVEKLRVSLSEKQNIYQSSTARAMFYGALTTSSSFAGLAFSPHQGIASMGVVITIGIFWIMTSTFVILPALSKLVLKAKAH